MGPFLFKRRFVSVLVSFLRLLKSDEISRDFVMILASWSSQNQLVCEHYLFAKGKVHMYDMNLTCHSKENSYARHAISEQ